MITYEDLINSIKIESPMDLELNLPEITNEAIPDEINMSPNTLNELNHILKYFNLPQFQISDSIEEKLSKIKKIKKNRSFSTDKLIAKYNKIMIYKGYENDCDMKEILIANTELGCIKKYSDMTVEDLTNYLNDLRDSMNFQGTVNNLEANKEELIHSLYFLKEKTHGIYLKNKLISLLSNNEEISSKILLKILNEKCCKVENISADLGIDRVSILKIIYNFCSKDILKYDRINDSVSI